MVATTTTTSASTIAVVESPAENLYGCYESGNTQSDGLRRLSPEMNDGISIGESQCTFSNTDSEYINPKHNNFMGKVIANANTGNKINKSLTSLTMHEVKYLLECLEMQNEYIMQFMNKEICGSILYEISTVEDLKECDIELPTNVAKMFLRDLEILKTKCLASIFTL
jgi:hypothetical protein